ncbi:hypothetical protein F7Q92_17040 [Ideonella dechloratans]|uniref:DUF4760 domain-containing protein n=1 Tax=Ideonella dechloratans TaxID=36863 RepID=A0A643F8A8_IDEDE|nr:hypothetical protein [Ideonella dechloratans]KAB0577067.1 hypothetical protein F7Q92_17040 [Ideonella dechloratans]UFU08645.1 hypothetical protein LRM40_09850 [Ideonella dechloratans]
MFINEDNANIFSATFAGLAFIFSLISLAINFHTSRKLKQADILSGLNSRFDALQAERAKLLTRTTPIPPIEKDYEVHIFFDRFWSLQFDEFVAWQHGNLADEVYRFWTFARWRQLTNPPEDWIINGSSVKSSLQEACRRWTRQEPHGFTDRPLVNGFIDMFGEISTATREIEVTNILNRYTRAINCAP